MDVTSDSVTEKIRELIAECGGAKDEFEQDLITQQIQTSLRMLFEGHNKGQLKLITRSLKEMRYAYRIFNQNQGTHRVSIFGSARTPENHPDYHAAEELSRQLAKNGWRVITGAANGIMKAGMAGLSPDSSFGLSIRLPFEAPANQLIEGDPKLIHFRYFFTRKLMFISHSEAIAVFPGGFGTMDELFEVLTLIQTGKANIVPIVLMEKWGGEYWQCWENYVENNLRKNGWISPEDRSFYYIAPSIEEGVDHILRFYRRYHSSRYVKDLLVIRMKSGIGEADLEELKREFSGILKGGTFEQRGALPEEKELEELPRLVFQFNRKDFGILRRLIDRVNAF